MNSAAAAALSDKKLCQTIIAAADGCSGLFGLIRFMNQGRGFWGE